MVTSPVGPPGNVGQFKGVRASNSAVGNLLPNFYLNNFWYATSEPVKKKLRVKGEISEKKLIEDTEILIDVHVKLKCIFLKIYGGDPHFLKRIRIPHTENRLKINFGKNLDFIKKY